ncbi:glycerate kinase [Shewanella putrefaciens]|uniref:glycerate kinase n=1 Tax=Shewanella putrefaciens TaxID=24 RepID=UPI0021C0F55C|nr:glycerate kinase [Shewanella putrefaciens]UXK10089.1 glycerate kinase [Shewanella putrefaciens]
MQYRIYILELTQWGCGFEGEVAAKCDNGAPIWFYYQGSDQQAKARFPLNQWVTVELLGRLASASPQVDIIEQAPHQHLQFPLHNCHFEASGQIIDISQTPEDTIYLLQSNLPLPFDNELGKSPISLSDWVNVTGELWVTNWMN